MSRKQQHSEKPKIPRAKLRFRRARVRRDHPLWPKREVPILLAFMEDEAICPFLMLNGDGQIGKIAARAASLYLSRLEALKSLTILNFLNEMIGPDPDPVVIDGLVVRSLFDSALIWYAKLYIDSDAGRIKLDATRVYEGKPQLIQLHDRLIEMRHKSVAHQTGAFDRVIPYAAFSPDETKKEVLEFYYDIIYPQLDIQRNLTNFIELADITAKHLEAMIIRSEKRMLEEIEGPQLDYLYEQSMKFHLGQGKSEESIEIEDEIETDNFKTYDRFHK